MTLPIWAKFAADVYKSFVEKSLNDGVAASDVKGAWVAQNRHAIATAWVKDPVLRCAFREWIDHPRIGPFAKNDGDIVAWWLASIEIAIADFMRLDHDRHLPVEQVPPVTAAPTAAGKPLDDFRSVGEWMFQRAHLPETAVPMNAWRDHYSRLEGSARSLWGGKSVRFRARPLPPCSPEEHINAALQKGVLLADIPQIAGVSRATMYRILGKKNSRLKLP